jgi:hypothetical protein
MLLLAGYLGWAAVGHATTGRYPLFWMDPKEMGGPVLVATCAALFVAVGSAGEQIISVVCERSGDFC